MKKNLSILTLTIFIIPSVTFASWWNPTSWSIFSFFFPQNAQTEIITKPVVSLDATTTIVTEQTTTTTPEMTASTTVKKQVLKVSKPIATIQPLTQSPDQIKPTGTLCNGTYWNSCPSGQNLICPITGDAYCQLPKQPVQPISQLASSTTSTTTTNNIVDKGTPYKAQDGNWYYPNAFNADGSYLQVPMVPTASMDSIDSNISTITASLTNGKYLAQPLLSLNITNQSTTTHLRNLTVHFKTNGTVQVTTAYLYQGTTPLSSALVSNGLSVFDIPDGTYGASFSKNIPTSFNITADISGVTMTTCTIMNRGYIENTVQEISPFSITSNINSSDIKLFDNSNNSVLVNGEASSTVTSHVSLELTMEGESYKCSP